MKTASEHRPTQAIVNLKAIRSNLKHYKAKMAPNQGLYAVVKADAYGHGAVAVAQTVRQEGVDGLCVATVDEAIQLRKAGIEDLPILVLGLTSPYGIAEIILYDITVTVSNIAFFEIAQDQLNETPNGAELMAKGLTFHLALDTGMSRIGLKTRQEIADFNQAIKAYSWAHWQGVFTHFSTAAEGDNPYLEKQWAKWQYLTDYLPESVTQRHFANSAMGLHPKYGPLSDIVRLGICLYGLYPDDFVPLNWQNSHQLKQVGMDSVLNQMVKSPLELELMPALSLVTEIVYTKQIEAGECISYGATYKAEGAEWIATLPIGYADGWLRAYHDIQVLCQGHICPVLGVINMDQMMVRLPEYFPIGTQVTLIGQDQGLFNHPSLVAQESGTIGYEITCNLSQRVPRVYL